MQQPTVERSFDEPYIRLACRCGWNGYDVDIDEWVVERERDRAVRRCPSCDEPVPEWGAVRPLTGADAVGRGPLAEALAEMKEL